LSENIDLVFSDSAKILHFRLAEGHCPFHPPHFEEPIYVHLCTPFMASSTNGRESVFQPEAYTAINPGWVLQQYSCH
jgi:hypothetical protein